MMTPAHVLRTRDKITPRKLDQMRRQLIRTAWSDYKLFGYRTEAVKHLARQIARAKMEQEK